GVTEILSLAKARGGRPVRHVQLLGARERISYRQTDRALVINVPQRLPSRHASVFKVGLA
ncbi:MAG: alpha-L-fucosidase, partial [Asticcacaulis sp.]|nr:alpha-L-fucosidase [Asticcacaulis sp.]